MGCASEVTEAVEFELLAADDAVAQLAGADEARSADGIAVRSAIHRFPEAGVARGNSEAVITLGLGFGKRRLERFLHLEVGHEDVVVIWLGHGAIGFVILCDADELCGVESQIVAHQGGFVFFGRARVQQGLCGH